MRDRPEQGDRQQPVKNKQNDNHRVSSAASGHARLRGVQHFARDPLARLERAFHPTGPRRRVLPGEVKAVFGAASCWQQRRHLSWTIQQQMRPVSRDRCSSGRRRLSRTPIGWPGNASATRSTPNERLASGVMPWRRRSSSPPVVAPRIPRDGRQVEGRVPRLRRAIGSGRSAEARRLPEAPLRLKHETYGRIVRQLIERPLLLGRQPVHFNLAHRADRNRKDDAGGDGTTDRRALAIVDAKARRPTLHANDRCVVSDDISERRGHRRGQAVHAAGDLVTLGRGAEQRVLPDHIERRDLRRVGSDRHEFHGVARRAA